jgi:predicted MFS family arabinose efflux permease
MLSGALIALLSGILSDRFGIDAPFLVMGCLGGVGFFFTLLTRREN